MHVTPQIECVGETSPLLWVLTHIYGISKEIDGEMFNVSSKPRHVTPQINCLINMKSYYKVFNIHLWGFQEDRWENMLIFRGNLSMCPIQLIILEKHEPCS